MNGIFKKYLFLIMLFPLFCNSAYSSENLHLGSKNNLEKFIIPFEDFKKIFFNTQTFADYVRSTKMLEEKFNLKINLKILKKKNQSDTKTLLQFVETLFIEAIKKAKFKKNNFYSKLQNLSMTIKNKSDFYIVELKLVKLKQEYFFIDNKNNENFLKNDLSKPNEVYLNHIIDTIRYDIFLKFLNSNTILKKQKIKNLIQSKPLPSG